MTTPPEPATEEHAMAAELTLARFEHGNASLRVLGQGAIAIEVGGRVFVKTIDAWHALASVESLAGPPREPVGWRYRYSENGRTREWRYVTTEGECNWEPCYQREPLFDAAPGPSGVKEEGAYTVNRTPSPPVACPHCGKEISNG